ncbi:phosphate ABC transporter permease [Haloarcula onubensis]|uniref:Phosphate ABC transporter permease n=1 Tax=Haloarcula onubensis TaxID=2950539 RepID=A0ABU2FMT5_9EURY|nr:phosphate ABC transporter permease [Halomicroarcula sp. S3CR25-11]MDS0282074.1 phosphate ABC transporter permease [Halomicroarcula sp. S3CR25-11]
MSTRLGRLRAGESAVDARIVAAALTGLTAVAVAGRFALALVVNAPGTVSGAPLSTLSVAATAAGGAALVALGPDRADPLSGIGLLFAGVFGLLSLAGAAAVPAAVAVPTGLALFAVAARERVGTGPGLLVCGLLAALGLALASGVGGVAPLRPVASTATLLALGTTPLLAGADGRAFVAGCVALGVVVATGLALPFATGAVTLVAVGAVGSPLPVVAIAVGGSVTTASAALSRRDWGLLAGVALVTCAGVPATVARAVPFALGAVTLVAWEGER